MSPCDQPTRWKPSKPKKNQPEFQIANPDAPPRQRAIEVIAHLLLSVPDDVWTENSTSIAA
jgi:hypothetical protein